MADLITGQVDCLILPVDADDYLREITSTLAPSLQAYIDYDSLAGIEIYSGADTRNFFEAVLKIALACRRFVAVGHDGKLTFVEKPETAKEILQDNISGDIEIVNERQELPDLIQLYAVNAFNISSTREEITTWDGYYYGSAFDPPQVVWVPSTGEYYQNIQAEFNDQQPGEAIFYYNDNGNLAIYRQDNLTGEKTVEVSGFKQNISTGWSWTRFNTPNPIVTVINYCIFGASERIACFNWWRDNYLLFRRCAIDFTGSPEMQAASKIAVNTQFNQTWQGLITNIQSEYDGGYDQRIEGYGNGV